MISALSIQAGRPLPKALFHCSLCGWKDLCMCSMTSHQEHRGNYISLYIYIHTHIVCSLLPVAFRWVQTTPQRACQQLHKSWPSVRMLFERAWLCLRVMCPAAGRRSRDVPLAAGAAGHDSALTATPMRHLDPCHGGLLLSRQCSNPITSTSTVDTSSNTSIVYSNSAPCPVFTTTT